MPANLCNEILNALTSAIGPAAEMVLLHRPYLPETAWDYVKECLDTGWVSSAGEFVSKFEEKICEITGAKRAVATTTGTAALEICYRVAGVQPGDEVLCPSLTFVATANAISHCGAVPHFVDVSTDRLSVCPETLRSRLRQIARNGVHGIENKETGRRIGALCLMHCLGHAGDLEAISAICREYEIPLIEDAAESLGSYYRKQHTGTFGMLAAFSFNGNKIVTTGGGGVIVTNDETLADLAKHLTTTAKVPHPWEFYHDQVGWNYRLPNINAALGIAQLEVLPKLIEAKRNLAARYQQQFEFVPNVSILVEPQHSRSNYWLNCMQLNDNDNDTHLRDLVLQSLNEAGFQSRPLWQPMHTLPMFSRCSRTDLVRTEAIGKHAILLPSSAQLAVPFEGM